MTAPVNRAGVGLGRGRRAAAELLVQFRQDDLLCAGHVAGVDQALDDGFL